MNCKYCQKELLQFCKENRPPELIIIDMICHPCRVCYQYVMTDWQEPLLVEEGFYFEVHDRLFYLILRPIEKKTVIERLLPDTRYNDPAELHYTGIIILTLNHIPNWTPSNIKEKLQLLLPLI